MPCLFQSTTQEEELPPFVSGDSSRRDAASAAPHTGAQPDAFKAFLLPLFRSPSCPSSSQKNTRVLLKATDKENCFSLTMPFGCPSCDSLNSDSQKATESRDRGLSPTTLPLPPQAHPLLATLTPNPISQRHAATAK